MPLSRHIWFGVFWIFHIVHHMVYVLYMLYWYILIYTGMFSPCVWIHIFPWQRQGIEGSARGILENNAPDRQKSVMQCLCPFRNTLGGMMEIQKSSNLPVPLQLLVFLCYRSTRVFSGQEGPCLCKSSALFHYFSGLLALGSYYISFVSRWAGDSRSIVKSSDLSQGTLFQCSNYKKYQ